MSKRLLTGGLGASLIAIAGSLQSAHAFDVDPRDYIAAPPGANLAILYSGVIRDASSEPGIDLIANINIGRAVFYREFMGVTIDPQVLIPFGSQDLDIDDVGSLDAAGIADPILAATIWFVNTDQHQFGVTPFLSVPLGDYDNEASLNLGTNNWVGTLQAGYVYRPDPGTAFEIVGDVTVATDNDDFGPESQTLETDPGYQIQFLASHNVSPKLALGVNLSHQGFGAQSIDGVESLEASTISKASLYAQYQVAPTFQVQAKFTRELDVEDELRQPFEAETFQIRLLQVF